jgi:hypothetical protein
MLDVMAMRNAQVWVGWLNRGRHNACLVAVAPQLACAAEWDCFST